MKIEFDLTVFLYIFYVVTVGDGVTILAGYAVRKVPTPPSHTYMCGFFGAWRMKDP